MVPGVHVVIASSRQDGPLSVRGDRLTRVSTPAVQLARMPKPARLERPPVVRGRVRCVRPTFLAALGLTTVLAACRAPEPVDLLLHNGTIATMDNGSTLHRAIAVRNGLIVAVGGDDLTSRYQGATVIDLGGRLVVPGFNDTHVHITGQARRHVDLSDVRSVDELKARVRQKAEQLGPGQWVTGYGWAEDDLSDHRLPQKSDLDEVTPSNPVVLTRAGGHSAVVNSAALTLAGVRADARDPDGGVFERGTDGQMTGVIRERLDVFTQLVPQASSQELRETFLANLKDLFSLGITSIIHAGATPTEFVEWQEMYRRYGEELPRASVQIRWVGAQALRVFGRRTGDGNDHLRVGAVKMVVDGGFTGPAAYTLDPYRGQPTYFGKLSVTEAALNEAVETSHSLGWQLGFHAIGDAAIKLTVDAFQRALRYQPRDDHRHYLTHFTVPPPEETLQVMTKFGILVAHQPNFTYTLEARYVAALEGYKLLHNNPLRTPMGRGIFVALGSDMLPLGPMVGIYAAVTRKGKSGTVYGADEALSIEEALRGYTRNGAFLTREERIKGTLEPGKLADFAVLNENLLTLDPAKILGVKVDLTVMGGRVVYERK